MRCFSKSRSLKKAVIRQKLSELAEAGGFSLDDLFASDHRSKGKAAAPFARLAPGARRTRLWGRLDGECARRVADASETTQAIGLTPSTEQRLSTVLRSSQVSRFLWTS